MVFPQVTLPIFIPWRNGAFGTHGSGVALSFKGRHFIATAAHVNDGDGYTDDLLVGQSSLPSSLVPLRGPSVSTPMPASGIRGHDLIDMAVIPISAKVADGLRATNVTFIGFDGMPTPAATPGDELLFTGFPEKQQRFFPLEGGQMFVEPKLAAVWIKQIPADTATGMGYSLGTHLVGRFRHAETRHVAPNPELEKPNGMSGGAAWLVSGDVLLFAGIVTRWDSDGNAGHLIATRTSFLPGMLKQALEELPDPG